MCFASRNQFWRQFCTNSPIPKEKVLLLSNKLFVIMKDSMSEYCAFRIIEVDEHIILLNRININREKISIKAL